MLVSFATVLVCLQSVVIVNLELMVCWLHVGLAVGCLAPYSVSRSVGCFACKFVGALVVRFATYPAWKERASVYDQLSMPLLGLFSLSQRPCRFMHACTTLRALLAVLKHIIVLSCHHPRTSCAKPVAIDARGHTRKRADALLHVLKATHHREHKCIFCHIPNLM